MSWTEQELQARCGDFFDKRLVPLAEARRLAEQPTLAEGFDEAVETYFDAPRRPKMSRDDFVLPASDSIAAFTSALRQHWLSQGQPELAAAVDDLTELGKIAEAIAEDNDDPDDVSPFLYAMF